jgi:hypothetical protein
MMKSAPKTRDEMKNESQKEIMAAETNRQSGSPKNTEVGR